MFKFTLTTKNLSLIAMLTALEIVLNRFLSINTDTLKIGFAFVPVVVCAVLLGPIPAAIVCALGDFLGALMFPRGPYHPGFSLVGFAMGLVYGIFLYNLPKYTKKQMYIRILAASLINSIVLGLFINTIWISQLYGSKTYFGFLTYRTGEYLVEIPLRLLIIPALCPLYTALSKTHKNTL